jgi:AcrR family transcriptional regulator
MLRNIGEQEKKRILVVAAKLFRDKSFLNTTVDDIASNAKINKAMIYYYFKSKGVLLYEIMCISADERIRQAELVIASNTSAVEKMEMIVKQVVESVTNSASLGGLAQFEIKNLPRHLMASYIGKRDRFEQILRQVLQEGVDTGYFRIKHDIPMISRFIMGLLNSVATWFKENGPLSPEEISKQIWSFIAPSLGFQS